MCHVWLQMIVFLYTKSSQLQHLPWVQRSAVSQLFWYWQRCPLVPLAQRHLKPPVSSTQLPPFSQGSAINRAIIQDTNKEESISVLTIYPWNKSLFNLLLPFFECECMFSETSDNSFGCVSPIKWLTLQTLFNIQSAVSSSIPFITCTLVPSKLSFIDPTAGSILTRIRQTGSQFTDIFTFYVCDHCS